MSNQVVLPENLTIHHIKDHFAELKPQIESEDDELILDAGAIETIDTSGLQMLLVFVQDLQARDVKLNWINVRDSFTQSAQSIGLADALSLI